MKDQAYVIFLTEKREFGAIKVTVPVVASYLG